MNKADELFNKLWNLVLDFGTIDDFRVLEELRDIAKCQEWIIVEERLPDAFRIVLIFKLGKWDICGMGCYANGQWYSSPENIKQTEVTHWMPLPAPPELKK